ncbi:MAG TPA: class E sortase [Gaiellaceae bacterium]|nr:class E sortase [Gaiellaceae bacterium]
MRRIARGAGLVLAVVGALTLVWAVVVWQWQDPFTGLYTTWQQHRLEGQLNREFDEYGGPRHAFAVQGTGAEAHAISVAAARLRRTAGLGQPIGRIVIPRLGLNMILVNGTDEGSLERGPGRDPRTYMPGQNRLVYIAGHRTTYLAPFSHIDQIRAGDPITLEMPYATFLYRAVRHIIVPADDLAVLRSPRHELLALQACHPRFFATHRYIVYARLRSVKLRDGASLSAQALAAAATTGS